MAKAHFYKHDLEPDKIWINKEYLIQLNLTGKCPYNCDFCYMKCHRNNFLSLAQIKKLWNNLRKYYKEEGVEYRVNITGGDVFFHPEWREIAKFIAEEKSIVAVDPLLNRIWKEEDKELFTILGNKITFVQFNSDAVKDSDIQAVKDIGKTVVLKISLSATTPTGLTTPKIIGGFHYGKIRNSITISDVSDGLVSNSCWDLKHMPKCYLLGLSDPSTYQIGGMVEVVTDSLWVDIYLVSDGGGGGFGFGTITEIALSRFS